MIVDVKSDGPYEKYSDGTKLENDEIAFKVDLEMLFCYGFKPRVLQAHIENLYLLGKLNPNNKVFTEYRDILDKCIFNGHRRELDDRDLFRLKKLHAKKEVDVELRKLSLKNVFRQSRVYWEIEHQIFFGFYKRMAIHVADKSVKHITPKEVL